ncbi:zinc finger MYM-type protein 1-like [Prunus dulcis]|uniref:zinc finger MYM-type protein 1-like n=1 Tax=Prunus dulcis TaxID=3755 RepID=UPI001482FBBE|nr:zinc finger MYM-type protein 1-like [Prunus dulcis]
MERYFQRKSINPPSNNPSSSNPPTNNPASSNPPSNNPSSSNPPSNNPASSNPPSNNPASSNQPSNNPPTSHPPLNYSGSPKRSQVTELDEILANLPADPGLRPPMNYYNPNVREQIRRAYLQRGPCQPKSQNDMPQTLMGESNRRFLVKWFDSFVWLEYSKEKDAAFCFHCYLFKCDFDKQGKAGSDVFTEKGFKNWRKGPENFRDHVGQVGSLHNKATQHCTDLMNQKQHVETIVIKQTDQARINYRILLTAALDCTRYLLRQGLPFRGHDESETSSNKGNYVELLQFLANHDEKVRAVVFENAPKNLKYIAPTIQKDLINSCAAETIDLIISDMDDAFFSILVDESRDVSIREQMAVVLRYVNKKGQVIERFVGVQYVSDTTSSKLKEAIEQLISSTNLSMSRLRGQGYDGASNMRGELNGLKTQILREYPQAYYVHCFAHQLQLALVAVAKGNENIATFFTTASSVVNIIGASCKRRDALREQQQKDIMETLEIDDLETGRGLNQETTLKRPCDTRWNSHYDTLLSINIMFHPVVKVLEWIVDDVNQDNLGEANRLLKEIQTFDFVFHLYLMRFILGITNDLSKALQKKDQDIVNAMMLVQRCKQKLQSVRDDDFDDLLREVSIFCGKNDIDVPNMDDLFVPQGRSRRKAQKITNRQYYRVDLFLTIIDKQLVELNNRFTEVNTELLLCMACLSPAYNFAAFDKQKILRFAKFYPQEFNDRDLMKLEDQLGLYIVDMQSITEFSSLNGITDLAEKLVNTGRSRIYNYVYLLLTLALVLPVATASVERAFSAMNIVKTPLRNKMGNQWLSDSLVVYIEKDVFSCISNANIMRRFHDMKPRRQQL